MDDDFTFPCLKCGHECNDVAPVNDTVTCPSCGFVEAI